jgi:hypothetical protein
MSDTFEKSPYFRDKVLGCSDCKEEFVWAWQDQRDMNSKEQELKKNRPNLKLNSPQLCPVCRRRRRKEEERIAQIRQRQEQRMKEEIQKERGSEVPLQPAITVEAGFEMTLTRQ